MDEIEAAEQSGKPVLELPSGMFGRELSLKNTVERLRESGQR
jgi:hypothetical protein